MAISDMVVGNITTLYLAVITAIKAYGLAAGTTYSGVFVLILSTALVALLLVTALTWDVYRKATYTIIPTTDDHHDHGHHELCRGGICWHGVAVKSPASEVRFRLPLVQP